MKNCWVIIVIFFLSCDSNKKFEASIYDEYITTFYDSYIQTKFELNLNESNWNVGDTIIIDKDCNLSNYSNDSLSFIHLNTNDSLIIKSTSDEIVELFLISDTNRNGFINKENLQNLTPYYRYIRDKKVEFYDKYNLNKLNLVDSLISKYDLSKNEFYEILVKENYKRTNSKQFIMN